MKDQTQLIMSDLIYERQIKLIKSLYINKMYFRELPCIYHPSLFITNFCQDQTCLMPLCPSCIREHTSYHTSQQTIPLYSNIYQSITQTDTLLTNCILNLQKDKKRNSQLIFGINRLPAIVKDKIAQLKLMTIKYLEQAFVDLERDTLEKIQQINIQADLHSIRKAEAYQQAIVRNLQELYDLVDGLKADRCLADMIFFLKDKRFEVQQLHNELSHYLYTNQNYSPYIQISKQAQQSLGSLMQRMLKLQQKQVFPLRRKASQPKNLYQNAYHISLTPPRKQAHISTNTSYKNFNDYQEQIIRQSPKGIRISQRERFVNEDRQTIRNNRRF